MILPYYNPSKLPHQPFPLLLSFAVTLPPVKWKKIEQISRLSEDNNFECWAKILTNLVSRTKLSVSPPKSVSIHILS